MTYLQHQRNPLQSVPGLAAVITLHVALIYALVYGLRTNTAPTYEPPIKAHVIEPTVIIPPPPPPPQQPTLVTPLTPTLPLPTIDIPTPPTPRTPLNIPRAADGTQPQPPAAPAAEHNFQPAAIIAGDPAPAYPEAYQDATRAGRVTVDCIIETTGVPTNCRAIAQTGGAAFATETLRWLTGPTHPTYRPAIRDGRPRREEHQWTITFQPAE